MKSRPSRAAWFMLFVLCAAAPLAACGSSGGQAPVDAPLRVAIFGDRMPPFINLWVSFQASESDTPMELMSFDDGPAALIASLADFDVVLFGDGADSIDALAVFDAASAAGVPMLGIGNGRAGAALVRILADDGRYGLTSSDDYDCDIIQVTADPASLAHPIFAGQDTSQSILFETTIDAENDEEHFSVDGMAVDAPADWRVLARISDTPGACYQNEVCMATFTTAGGARVLLDGSAGTYDNFVYYTDARWTVLMRQLLWLGGKLE